MNFFVQAVEDPNLIVNTLSVYSNITDDIEQELFDLCYYTKISYIDASLMSFIKRRFWIKAINKKHEVNKPDNVINSADF